MSGPKSHKNGVKTTSPSSLRENLQRKLEIIRGLSEPPHNSARNSGVRRGKVPYYESADGHHPYDGSSAMYLYLMKGEEYESWAKPTKRIIPPLPPNNRTGGRVGPEIDWSVRARNMPIIFIKQMKHTGVFVKIGGRRIFQEYFNILFTNREFVHPKNRPKVGCSPTFHWTDFQVKTWTEMAHKLGVHYHGKHDYTFPKGCLGIARKGSYYTSNAHPWPYETTDKEGNKHVPFYKVPKKGRKRSDKKRIERALAKVRRAEVKPIDFKDVLVQRKVMSRKSINRLYNKSDRSMTIREFRDSIPDCLSVNIGPPMPVSPIVRRSIRTLCSRAQKFDPDKPWIVPEPPVVIRNVQQPFSKRDKSRLMATYCGDGRYYITRANLDNSHNVRNGHNPEKVKNTLNSINAFIDEASDEEEVYGQYGYSGLGDWND